MSTTKQEVESLLSRLPDNCSVEDVQYHLYVFEKVRRGLKVADTQGTLTQEEAEDRRLAGTTGTGESNQVKS